MSPELEMSGLGNRLRAHEAGEELEEEIEARTRSATNGACNSVEDEAWCWLFFACRIHVVVLSWLLAKLGIDIHRRSNWVST